MKPRANWRSHSTRSGIRWKEFAWELQDLMGIPRQVHHSKGGFRYERPDTATKTIQSIIKVMTDALRRGESVQIRGFGTFEVIDNPKTKVYRPFTASSPDGEPLGQSLVSAPLPPRKKVIFKPSLHLLAMLNQESPNKLNAGQSRAMKTWKVYEV